ncbi:unnamed protein product [Rhodiola kirilowii]
MLGSISVADPAAGTSWISESSECGEKAPEGPMVNSGRFDPLLNERLQVFYLCRNLENSSPSPLWSMERE